MVTRTQFDIDNPYTMAGGTIGRRNVLKEKAPAPSLLMPATSETTDFSPRHVFLSAYP